MRAVWQFQSICNTLEIRICRQRFERSSNMFWPIGPGTGGFRSWGRERPVGIEGNRAECIRAVVAALHRENFNSKDRAPLHSSSSLPLPLRPLPRLALVEGGHRQPPSGHECLSRRILDVVCSYSNGTPYGPVVKSFASLDSKRFVA